MRAAISILLLSVFFISVSLYQLDTETALLANERLKDAVNRAAHDASLQIDRVELSNGRIVFDPAAAAAVFGQTLAANLGLDENLDPKPGTMFSGRAQVEYMEYLDDSSGKSFPLLYENPVYGITKTVRGPAVVAVVSIPKPVTSGLSSAWSMRKWAVYEYPGVGN